MTGYAKPPKGRGRPPGATNKVTRDLRALMEAEAQKATGDAKPSPLPALMVRLGFRYLAKGEEIMDAGIIATGARLLTQASEFAYPTLKQIDMSVEGVQMPLAPVEGPPPAQALPEP